MKLVVSGGGTGGHVYPALTVVEVLRGPKPQEATLPTLDPADVLWIGSRGGMEEELVGRARIEYVGLAAGGLRGMDLLARGSSAAWARRGGSWPVSSRRLSWSPAAMPASP
jgi:UDP-N-acetylglucosamine:LPS N-acetylglucosamine transferase